MCTNGGTLSNFYYDFYRVIFLFFVPKQQLMKLGYSNVKKQYHISNILKLQNIVKRAMLRKIQQQNKTIQFIKDKYKQKTGEEILMPKNWEQYLDIDTDDAPVQNLPQIPQQKLHNQTFQLAIDKLSLPSRINANKAPLTSFNPSNKFHMIDTIKLDGFKDKGFSKQLFRDFLSRIVEMRCLRSISLKNNGISDNCTEEIQSLFTIKRIVRIDISRNQLGKSCLQIITKNFQHLQWIDLSRNSFMWENLTLIALLNSIRQNPKIYHIGLDLQQPKNIHTLSSFLKIKPQIHSFAPVDSKIDNESMIFICHAIQSTQVKKDQATPRLISLNFNFCYLEAPVFRIFLKALSGNTSLIRLQLASNNLGDNLTSALNNVLQSNFTLTYLGLQNNLLEDQFAKSLAFLLQKNQILQTVDISRNNISDIGAKQVSFSLSQKNDTLQSLGKIERYTYFNASNGRISPQISQKIRKALRINKVSKQIRASLLKQQGDLNTLEITNRQTQAFLQAEYQDYQLLIPIAISNPVRDEPYQLNIWNFD